MALAEDDGLIGVAMTQAVRHIIIMVWARASPWVTSRASRVHCGFAQERLSAIDFLYAGPCYRVPAPCRLGSLRRASPSILRNRLLASDRLREIEHNGSESYHRFADQRLFSACQTLERSVQSSFHRGGSRGVAARFRRNSAAFVIFLGYS